MVTCCLLTPAAAWFTACPRLPPAFACRLPAFCPAMLLHLPRWFCYCRSYRMLPSRYLGSALPARADAACLLPATATFCPLPAPVPLPVVPITCLCPPVIPSLHFGSLHCRPGYTAAYTAPLPAPAWVPATTMPACCHTFLPLPGCLPCLPHCLWTGGLHTACLCHLTILPCLHSPWVPA